MVKITLVNRNPLQSLRILAALVLYFSVCISYAQTTESGDQISDEELLKYVEINSAFDSLKGVFESRSENLILGHKLMDKGRIYNGIKHSGGDSTKLSTLNLCADHVMAYDSINLRIESFQAEFKKEYLQVLDSELGIYTFNKIRRLMSSDDELIQRYHKIAARLEDQETI